MSRFCCQVHRVGSVADDEEGQEIASLRDACQEAISAIRTILAAEVLGGTINLSG